MAQYPKKVDEEPDFEEEEDEEEEEIQEYPKRLPPQPTRRPKLPQTSDLVKEAAVKEPIESEFEGRKPVGRPRKEEVKKAEKRYVAFLRPQQAGIVDTQTQELLYEVPQEFLWLAEMIAEIKNTQEEVKDMLGRI